MIKNTAVYKIRIPDIILSIAVIFSSFWFIFGLSSVVGGDTNILATVYQENKVIKEISLNKDELSSVSLINDLVKIEVNREKGIRILESSCPAKVCIHSGWIKRTGETLVCLPNKILIEIKGEEQEYNAVSY